MKSYKLVYYMSCGQGGGFDIVGLHHVSETRLVAKMIIIKFSF